MEIEVSRRRCEAVVERIHGLPHSKITQSCKSTLLRLLHSELLFLSRLSLSPHPFSCNIGYIEAIVHLLQQPYITKVSCVCKSISLSSAASNGERSGLQSEAVHIDIVCSLNNSPAWFVVSDRNPKYITWDSAGRNKGFKTRIEHIVHAARSSQAMKPAFIVLFFANGLDITVIQKLKREFGFNELKFEFSCFDFAFCETLDDEWTNVLAKSYQGACTLVLDIDQCHKPRQSMDYLVNLVSTDSRKDISEMCNMVGSGFSFQSLILKMKEWPFDVKNAEFERKEELLKDDDVVNFDTTALIALISGISNGGAAKLLGTPENKLRQRFKSNTEFVISQAKSEVESPIHDELHCVISAKKGIVCKTVHSEFMDIVSMCGGHNEKMRANQLMKLLKIVPDSPSQRMMSLPTTMKLALKNKVAFGTGDHWGAPTLTANLGFVRAVSQTGMPLFTVEHRSRALIGE
ncbi:hypothetical protein RND81_08G014100 [Saponaria officinalis]|uniref:DUF1308 domain-containing protein n=2 Tax=Saponaria officinalis TaxID=3572 RepID=A0AAW1J283_SAPOF